MSTSARRPLAAAVLLLALAAVALWASSRATWVQVVSSDGLGEPRSQSLVGATWAAATTPLALVLVAAVAAVFAVRGRWTLLVAAAVVIVAVAAAVPAVGLLVTAVDPGRAAALAELPDRAEVVSADASRWPAALAVLGSLAALAGAVAIARAARGARGLSARYDAPAVRRARAEQASATAVTAATDGSGDGSGDVSGDVSERALWDALDAGQDPTAPDPSGPDRGSER